MPRRAPAPPTGPSPLEIVVAPAPFQPRVERMSVAPGSTVAEILLRACLDGVLDPQDLPRTEVDIDGERLLDRDAIATLRPAPGQIVNLTVQVYGGHGGNKALQAILQVAIMVAAFAIAGPAGSAGTAAAVNAGAAAGSFAATAAGVAAQLAAVSAVTLAGTALTSALNPSTPSAAQTYALETQSNQSRLREMMPLCLDQRRWAFDLASSAYTTFSGDDMWITAIYGLHYGPCTLTALKIGETLLTAYPAGEVQTETFLAPGPRHSTLYPTDIHQDSFQNTLNRETGDYALATTVDDATSFELDFYWAGGLYYPKTDGRVVTSDTKLYIEISPYGQNAWQPAPGFPAGVDKSGNHYPAGTYYVEAASKDPVRKTAVVTLPAQGPWDVRLHRDTRPVDDTNQDTVTWTAIRMPRPGQPVLDQTLSLLVLKVKASQDFSGSLGVVSGVVTPIVPVPGADGSWSTTAPSANAAALARWLVTGPAAAKPLSAAEVDASCAAQFALIEANGWDGGVLTTSGSQQDALNKLAAAGRFEVAWSGSALVFSPDWIKDSPRQVFAGRNAQNYARRREYPDPLHAVWVEFINAAEDWKQDGLFVYADGFTAANATLIESYSLDFGCNPTRAYKEGRAYIAKRELGVWTHEFSAFVDGIASSYGDRVRARRSSSLYGMLDARVAFRRWQGALVSGLRLDAEVLMEAGKVYALDARRPDGLVLNLQLVTTPGRVRDVVFAAPTPEAGSPGKGDLVAFGESGQVTEDLVIVDLDPRSDGTVTVRCANYIGPQLQAAETGAIPALTTFLSTRIVAPVPRILSATGSPAGVLVDFDVDPQRTAPLRGFLARWRFTPTGDEASSWSTLPLIPPAGRSVLTPAVSGAQHAAGDGDGEVRVDVELWSVLTTGEPSPAATANGVLVIQGVLPVTGFTALGVVRLAPDGSSYPALHVSADPVPSGAVQDLVIEIQPAGAAPPAWGSAGQPLAAANPIGDFTAVAGGKVYDVRARWRDAGGWVGDWVSTLAVAMPGNGFVSADTAKVGGTPAATVLQNIASALGSAAASVAAVASLQMTVGANAATAHAEVVAAQSTLQIAVSAAQTDATSALAGVTASGVQISGLQSSYGTLTAQVSSNYTALTTANTALSGRIDTVTATAGVNTAAISSESAARTTADTALGVRIDTLTSTVGANTSAISSESITRAAADSALTTQVTTLVAQTATGANMLGNSSFGQGATGWSISHGSAYAADPANGPYLVYNPGAAGSLSTNVLELARQTGVAFPSITYALQARFYLGFIGSTTTYGRVRIAWFNSAGALLSDTPFIQVNVKQGWATFKRDATSGGAIVSPVNTATYAVIIDMATSSGNIQLSGDNIAAGRLKLEVGSYCTLYSDDALPGAITASITSEGAARTAADGATATQITTLQTNVATNATAISSESTARTTADTALGSRIDTLASTVNGNTAAISSEATTRATADTALSTQVTTVSAKLSVRPNLLHNGGFSQGTSAWTFSNAFTLSGTSDPEMPFAYYTPPDNSTGYISLFQQRVTIPVGAPLSLQARMYSGPIASSNTYLRVNLNFLNSSGSVIPGGSYQLQTNQSLSWTDYKLENVVAPAGTVAALVLADLASSSGNLRFSGAAVGLNRIKLEEGSFCTSFTDDQVLGDLGASVSIQASTLATLQQVYGSYGVRVEADGSGGVIWTGLTLYAASGAVNYSGVAIDAAQLVIRRPGYAGVAPFLFDTTTSTAYLQNAIVHGNLVVDGTLTTNLFAPSSVTGVDYVYMDYTSAPLALGSAISTGTTSPGTGTGTGTGTGGGVGGGGGCPEPAAMILLADMERHAAGERVRAGDLEALLREGFVYVWTRHQGSTMPGPYKLLSAQTVEEARRTRVTLRDGRSRIYTWNHRVETDPGIYIGLDQLKPGQSILGTQPGVILSLERAEPGPVVMLSVAAAQTYDSDGLSSHNVKPAA